MLVSTSGGWTAGSVFGLHRTAIRAFLAFRASMRARAKVARAGLLAAHLKLPLAEAAAVRGDWAEWERCITHPEWYGAAGAQKQG